MDDARSSYSEDEASTEHVGDLFCSQSVLDEAALGCIDNVAAGRWGFMSACAVLTTSPSCEFDFLCSLFSICF